MFFECFIILYLNISFECAFNLFFKRFRYKKPWAYYKNLKYIKMKRILFEGSSSEEFIGMLCAKIREIVDSSKQTEQQ